MMSLANMIRGLEDDCPARELLALWAHEAESLRFVRASSNFVYTFSEHGAQYYLRFINERDQSLSALEAELHFIRYLLKQQYKAAAPVRSLRGRWIERIEIDGHIYYGVVFTKAAGDPLTLESLTEQQLYRWGHSLATLHNLSADYPCENSPHPSWKDALAFISAALQASAERISPVPMSQLLQAVDRIRQQLLQLPSNKETIGVIHYDFVLDNLFYIAGESNYCVIDFNDGMLHWFMMDVTSAIRGLLELEADQESVEYRLKLFLDGYRSVKELNEHYADLLPVFHSFSELYLLARLLRSIEGMEPAPANIPDWANGLYKKLLMVIDQVIARYAGMIERQQQQIQKQKQ